jgi:hypothetical protein
VLVAAASGRHEIFKDCRQPQHAAPQGCQPPVESKSNDCARVVRELLANVLISAVTKPAPPDTHVVHRPADRAACLPDSLAAHDVAAARTCDMLLHKNYRRSIDDLTLL